MHVSNTTYVHVAEADIDGITIEFRDGDKPVVKLSETVSNYHTLLFESTGALYRFAQRLVTAEVEHRREQLEIEAQEAGWRVYQ
jgi:hypothetical protein